MVTEIETTMDGDVVVDVVTFYLALGILARAVSSGFKRRVIFSEAIVIS